MVNSRVGKSIHWYSCINWNLWKTVWLYLVPLPSSVQSPHFPPASINLFFVPMSLFLFIDSTWVTSNGICLPLLGWLHLIFSRSAHVASGKISFLMGNIPCVLHLHPLIYSWTAWRYIFSCWFLWKFWVYHSTLSCPIWLLLRIWIIWWVFLCRLQFFPTALRIIIKLLTVLMFWRRSFGAEIITCSCAQLSDSVPRFRDFSSIISLTRLSVPFSLFWDTHYPYVALSDEVLVVELVHVLKTSSLFSLSHV